MKTGEIMENIADKRGYNLGSFCGSQQILGKVKGVRVSSHALERWNERVGPVVEEADILEELFEEMIIEGDRIVVGRRGIAFVDHDIVFAFFISPDDVMVIITFYGRVSCNVWLNNIYELLDFTRTMSDKIDLTIDRDLLEMQEFPEKSDFILLEDDEGRLIKIEIVARNSAFKVVFYRRCTYYRKIKLQEVMDIVERNKVVAYRMDDELLQRLVKNKNYLQEEELVLSS